MNRVFYICFICAVAVINIQTEEIRHFKRQIKTDDKWSWGYVEITTSQNKNESQNQQVPTVTIDYNQGQIKPVTSPTNPVQEETGPIECRPFYRPPTKPDYRKPGRRISETKCYEYIWELNDRVKTTKRLDMCTQYFNSLSGTDVGGAVGGRPTSPGEFPHMGAVGWKAVRGTWVFKCGSTLISEKFVLTAGHCTRASPLDTTIADTVPKMIRLGDKKITDDKPFTVPSNRFKDVDILRIIVHPQYKPPKKYYDIALMKLQSEVYFSKVVQPACLWNRYSTSELGKQATVTGWGVVEAGSLNISPELQAVSFDVLTNNECDVLLKANRNRNWNGMKENQICAGNLTGGVDSCQYCPVPRPASTVCARKEEAGTFYVFSFVPDLLVRYVEENIANINVKGDSGGPLQMKIPLPKNVTEQEGSLHYVVGVISFGVGCGLPNLPGIYTRVSSFIDWIEENVWKNQ